MRKYYREIDEEALHETARLFMYCFPDLRQASLDEFLEENREVLTEEQLKLGLSICRLFD